MLINPTAAGVGVTGGSLATLFLFGVDGVASSLVGTSTASFVAAFLFLPTLATLEGATPLDSFGVSILAVEAVPSRADLRVDILLGSKLWHRSKKAFAEQCLKDNGRWSLVTEDRRAAVAAFLVEQNAFYRLS